ncbi:hypothetical protein [Desulfosediminicola sp.]|uniref:hypothetical protein n=1 Tax=Desulfosediminicola sp. TaxID=2886825 RepID=UPI003AF26E53
MSCESWTIEIVHKSLVGDELIGQLEVINEAGHRLPTSIPVRRVFINFEHHNVHFESINSLMESVSRRVTVS